VCCCWFVQCLIRSYVGLAVGSVCFCQFLASSQPLFSVLVVLFIEDFFCCYSHLVMYYNSMIPQASNYVVVVSFLIFVQFFLPVFFKWVFPWDNFSLVASSHLSYFSYLIVHSSALIRLQKNLLDVEIVKI
jgi:hypothetical protein